MNTNIGIKGNDILSVLKEDFCSLWNYRERGNTIEIITPMSTITQSFISVFITKRNSSYVVSDGGWIQTHIQELLENTTDEDNKILDYFLAHYKIQIHSADKKKYYFKTHNDVKMLSAMTYDVAQFTLNTINALYSKYEIETQENIHAHRFDTIVNRQLQSRIDAENFKYFKNYQALNDLKMIRFSACIQSKNSDSIIIMMHITGSNATHFSNSVGRANQNFEIAKKSRFYNNTRRISILNDNASGYAPSSTEQNIFIDNLKDKSDIISWNNLDEKKFIIDNKSSLKPLLPS